jgi:hypothetical protein
MGKHGEVISMGEIADEMIDSILFGKRSASYSNKKGNNNMYNNNSNYPQYEREVAKIFKMQNADNGQYAVVVEKGVHKEVIITSFDRSKFRAKGFIKTNESIFNRNFNDVKEIINMHDVFQGLVNALNNLYSADLLIETQYNALLDGFEPFIFEALDFSEFTSYLEKDSSLNANKKKRISRRGRA